MQDFDTVKEATDKLLGILRFESEEAEVEVMDALLEKRPPKKKRLCRETPLEALATADALVDYRIKVHNIIGFWIRQPPACIAGSCSTGGSMPI